MYNRCARCKVSRENNLRATGDWLLIKISAEKSDEWSTDRVTTSFQVI